MKRPLKKFKTTIRQENTEIYVEQMEVMARTEKEAEAKAIRKFNARMNNGDLDCSFHDRGPIAEGTMEAK